MSQNKIESHIEEWVAESVVGAGFGDDNVADVKRDVFFGEAAFADGLDGWAAGAESRGPERGADADRAANRAGSGRRDESESHTGQAACKIK